MGNVKSMDIRTHKRGFVLQKDGVFFSNGRIFERHEIASLATSLLIQELLLNQFESAQMVGDSFGFQMHHDNDTFCVTVNFLNSMTGGIKAVNVGCDFAKAIVNEAIISELLVE